MATLGIEPEVLVNLVHAAGDAIVIANTQGNIVLWNPAAQRKDGQRLSIAFTVALLGDSDEQVTGIAAIIRDETERWQTEQALRQRLAVLEGHDASR